MKLICDCLCIFAILNNRVNNKSFFEMEKKDCFNFGAIFPDQSFFFTRHHFHLIVSLKSETTYILLLLILYNGEQSCLLNFLLKFEIVFSRLVKLYR